MGKGPKNNNSGKASKKGNSGRTVGCKIVTKSANELDNLEQVYEDTVDQDNEGKQKTKSHSGEKRSAKRLNFDEVEPPKQRKKRSGGTGEGQTVNSPQVNK